MAPAPRPAPRPAPLPAPLPSAAQRHPLALIAFGVVLYAIGPVFVAASEVPGPVFSFWRLWLGVPVLGLASLLYVRRGGRWPTRRGWRWSLYAGLSFGTHQVLFMTAIKATSVVDVALVGTLSPIITALGALPLFGERPGIPFRAWTVLAMVGAGIVVVGASSGPTGDPVGMTMAVLNVVFFAGFFLASKLGREETPVLPFLFGVMFVSAVGVSLFAAATAQPVTSISDRDLLYALAVASGPGALGHFVMTWPLRWVPANIPPVMRLGQPVLSGLLAWAFLGQGVGLAHLLGGGLVLLGVGGAVLSPSGRRFAARYRADPDQPDPAPQPT